MSEPILAAQSTWFAPNVSSVKRANITEIEIMDSYTPTGTVADTWDASAAKDGSVTCYVIGTKLIIAGNGSGEIWMNADSSHVFADANYADYFQHVVSIKNIQLFHTDNVTNLYCAFQRMREIASLDLSSWDTHNLTNIGQAFFLCDSLSYLNVSNWETEQIVNIASMLRRCRKLNEVIGFSNWNLPNLENCATCFDETLFTSLDLTKWNVSKVKNLDYMVSYMPNLANLNIRNWNTQSAESMRECFSNNPKLKNIQFSETFTTSLCTNMDGMFSGCSTLETLDVSNFDVSNVKFFSEMFKGATNLRQIDGLENWDTSSGLGFDGMFEGCSMLRELNISGFNTTKAKNGASVDQWSDKTATLKNMFLSCNRLEKVTVGANFSVNGDGTNPTAANKAILPTPSATYIPGADGNWYTFNGDQYAPNAMKDRTAATYYASFDMVADADVIVKNGSLIDTAKAIREKNGTTAQYTPSEFGAAIRALA